MLNISSQTFATFEAQSRRDFIAATVAALREEIPDFAAERSGGELGRLVEVEIERAARWEIEEEEAIGLMAAVTLVFGEEAWEEAAFADFIAAHTGDAVERLNAVLDAYDGEA